MVEIRGAGDRVFDGPDDRVADFGRGCAGIRKSNLYDGKIDIGKILLDDRSERERSRQRDQGKHDDDERRSANEELREAHATDSAARRPPLGDVRRDRQAIP